MQYNQPASIRREIIDDLKLNLNGLHQTVDVFTAEATNNKELFEKWVKLFKESIKTPQIRGKKIYEIITNHSLATLNANNQLKVLAREFKDDVLSYLKQTDELCNLEKFIIVDEILNETQHNLYQFFHQENTRYSFLSKNSWKSEVERLYTTLYSSGFSIPNAVTGEPILPAKGYLPTNGADFFSRVEEKTKPEAYDAPSLKA